LASILVGQLERKLLPWPLDTKILEDELSFAPFKRIIAAKAGNFLVLIWGRFLPNDPVLRAARTTINRGLHDLLSIFSCWR